MADDEAKAPEVPLDDEARQLLLDQKKAEARKAIAEAVEATTPDLQKTIGSTLSLGEKGGSSIASVEAARAAKSAAADIVKAVSAKRDVKVVVIVEDRSVAQSDIVLADVDSRLTTFANAFAEIESKVPELAAPPPSSRRQSLIAIPPLALLGLASLATSVIGLFRSDYVVSPRDVTADKLGLIAEVARGLRAKRRTVVLPGLGLIETSPLLTRFRKLIERRYKLERRIASFDNAKVAPMTRKVDALRTRLGQLQEAADSYHAEGKAAERDRTQTLVKSTIGEIEKQESNAVFADQRASIAAARSVVAAFDAAAAVLLATPSTGYSPLIAAALREKLKSLVAAGGGNAHLLYVEVSAAGADVVSRTSSGISGGKSAFLGASGVTFFLASSNGDLVDSGTFHRISSSVFDFDELKRVDTPAWTDISQ